MNILTPFIILIESRRLRRVRAVAIAAMALLAASSGVGPAHAQPPSPLRGIKPFHKVALDFADETASWRKPTARWARDVNGVRMVQAVLVSDSEDPDMRNLREHVVRNGGKVIVVQPAVHAMTVLVPAAKLEELAKHDDVISVAPNRDTQRTASTLESITGSLTSNVRTPSTKTSYTGVDGSGVGIAVLDSGVMREHWAFADSTAGYRLKRNVNMLKADLGNWTGTQGNLPAPNTTALSTYEAAIAADADVVQDPFGHGTHVASVAAGRAQWFSAGTPDTTGVAPNANIYDVRVLGTLGTGTLVDALEGIQWAIYHAKEYNIRVLNLSLATQSTQSWQVDPLCVAVRAATAAGITVVVAAGNFGLNAANQETYGSISSPGHEPSVITVGSVNNFGTTARGDDAINGFSSRGPTRGSYLDAAGVRQVDNLLKPDLVAPGNKIVGAAATKSTALTWNFLANTFKSLLVTPLGITATLTETKMLLSGTSIAAPAVSGTVALMLQANPGLTPPLIKAILQYSAQPVPGANLLQQGAGLLNVDGAVTLAKSLRT